MIPTALQLALVVLKEELKNDDGYAWSWHCNIAMPIFDCGVDAEIANDCAERLMKHLFDVDTSKLRKELRGKPNEETN